MSGVRVPPREPRYKKRGFFRPRFFILVFLDGVRTLCRRQTGFDRRACRDEVEASNHDDNFLAGTNPKGLVIPPREPDLNTQTKLGFYSDPAQTGYSVRGFFV